MWWMYVKVFEDENTVRYSFARESYETDGELEYAKGSEEDPRITKDSVTFGEYADFEREKIQEHFYHVLQEGFPDRKQVACG